MTFINIHRSIIKYQKEDKLNISYYIKELEMDWVHNNTGLNVMVNQIY